MASAILFLKPQDNITLICLLTVAFIIFLKFSPTYHLQEELEEADEFRASSSELEKMLEAELEAAKKEAREKDRRLQIAELELSRLQVNFQSISFRFN